VQRERRQNGSVRLEALKRWSLIRRERKRKQRQAAEDARVRDALLQWCTAGRGALLQGCTGTVVHCCRGRYAQGRRPRSMPLHYARTLSRAPPPPPPSPPQRKKRRQQLQDSEDSSSPPFLLQRKKRRHELEDSSTESEEDEDNEARAGPPPKSSVSGSLLHEVHCRMGRTAARVHCDSGALLQVVHCCRRCTAAHGVYWYSCALLQERTLFLSHTTLQGKKRKAKEAEAKAAKSSVSGAWGAPDFMGAMQQVWQQWCTVQHACHRGARKGCVCLTQPGACTTLTTLPTRTLTLAYCRPRSAGSPPPRSSLRPSPARASLARRAREAREARYVACTRKALLLHPGRACTTLCVTAPGVVLWCSQAVHAPRLCMHHSVCDCTRGCAVVQSGCACTTLCVTAPGAVLWCSQAVHAPLCV
jgi:hypothetical protein